MTESRISQIRSEALAMLRDGIDAQYRPADEVPAGRTAKRRAEYAAAISGASPWRARIAG